MYPKNKKPFSSGKKPDSLLPGNPTTDAPSPNKHSPITSESTRINYLFSEIQRQVDETQIDNLKDKADLKAVVGEIEQQVKKGEGANLTKLERWLSILAKMSLRIFETVLTALGSDENEIPTGIKLFIQNIKDEKTKNKE